MAGLASGIATVLICAAGASALANLPHSLHAGIRAWRRIREELQQ